MTSCMSARRAQLAQWAWRLAVVRACTGAVGCSTCSRLLNLQCHLGHLARPIATGIFTMIEGDYVPSISVERTTQLFAGTHVRIAA